ncbi:MAG: hypothetical protein WCP12_14650 [bacterium]
MTVFDWGGFHKATPVRFFRLHFQLAAPAGHRGGLIMLGVPQTGGFGGRGTFLFTAGARAAAGNLLNIVDIGFMILRLISVRAMEPSPFSMFLFSAEPCRFSLWRFAWFVVPWAFQWQRRLLTTALT